MSAAAANKTAGVGGAKSSSSKNGERDDASGSTNPFESSKPEDENKGESGSASSSSPSGSEIPTGEGKSFSGKPPDDRTKNKNRSLYTDSDSKREAEEELEKLYEALAFVGFDAEKIRLSLLNDATTERVNILKLIVTYLQIGNGVGRLSDARKVTDMEKASKIMKLLKEFKVKKGKTGNTRTLSQIAQAFLPVTLVMSCKLRNLNNPIFKPLFTGIPEFDAFIKEFDSALEGDRDRKRKEGEKKIINTTDWRALQIDGIKKDGHLCSWMMTAMKLIARGNLDFVLMLDLIANGEDYTPAMNSSHYLGRLIEVEPGTIDLDSKEIKSELISIYQRYSQKK